MGLTFLDEKSIPALHFVPWYKLCLINPNYYTLQIGPILLLAGIHINE
jgi:hypothetical protein